MSETYILQSVRLACGRIATLFRNNSGKLQDRTGRWVAYGVGPEGGGGSDLIGWKSVVVTPEMLNRKVAVFVAIEVKTATGKTTPAQENFIRVVREAGGIAGVVRSEAEAVAILEAR